MARSSKKLPREEIERMFYQLSVAISKTKNAKEAAVLLRDLISYTEADMIAKRLKIAEMILDGMSYDEIQKKLKVGAGKIARVHEWLKISGEGYRQAIARTKDVSIDKIYEIPTEETNYYSIKKRYPMYYWPQILLEDLVKYSNQRQKAKIKSVLKEMNKMKKKPALYRRLKKLFR